MEIKRIIVKNREGMKNEELSAVAQILREGGLVTLPTEIACGLGSNALDEDAAKKIYVAKGRPCDNPLVAHIPYTEELESLAKEVPEVDRRLMGTFWPGPLTVIFPRGSKVPYGTTGGLDTVAVRIPDDPTASWFITLVRVPIATPSVSTSGRPSSATADHVWQDMSGRVEMVIDGESMGIGVESTIVDVSSPVPAVPRPDAITMGTLREVLGGVTIDPIVLGPMSPGVRLKAPGMKYKHYAPKADPTLVKSEGVVMGQDQVMHVVETVRELTEEKCPLDFRVGIICMNESALEYPCELVRSIGVRKNQAPVVHNLYTILREFDDLEVDFIFSEGFTEDHLGQAITNRLSKTAGYRIARAQVGLGGKLGAGFGIQMSGSELKDRYQVNGKHKEDKMEKQTLREITAQKLLGMIQEKGYTTGGRPPTEAELVELLEVGRNTVRGALCILMSRDIVTVRQSSGTFISDKNGVADDPLGFSMIEDRRKLIGSLIQIRVMLEPPIAALAAQNVTPEDVLALEAVLLELEEYMERREDYPEKDFQPHAVVASCSHNLVMANLVPVITDGIQVSAGSVRETEYESIGEAYRRIFEATRNCRPMDAQQAVCFHLMFNDIRYKDKVK